MMAEASILGNARNDEPLLVVAQLSMAAARLWAHEGRFQPRSQQQQQQRQQRQRCCCRRRQRRAFLQHPLPHCVSRPLSFFCVSAYAKNAYGACCVSGCTGRGGLSGAAFFPTGRALPDRPFGREEKRWLKKLPFFLEGEKSGLKSKQDLFELAVTPPCLPGQ